MKIMMISLQSVGPTEIKSPCKVSIHHLASGGNEITSTLTHTTMTRQKVNIWNGKITKNRHHKNCENYPKIEKSNYNNDIWSKCWLWSKINLRFWKIEPLIIKLTKMHEVVIVVMMSMLSNNAQLWRWSKMIQKILAILGFVG